MGWSIKDRAGDMERGYEINKTACKNTKADIEASLKTDRKPVDKTRPKR